MERTRRDEVEKRLHDEIKALQTSRKRAREENEAAQEQIRKECSMEIELLVVDYNERLRKMSTELMGLRRELAEVKRSEEFTSKLKTDLVVGITALLEAHDTARMNATQMDSPPPSPVLGMGHHSDPDATLADEE